MAREVVFHSSSPEESFRLGKSIGERCREGDIICFDGTLGAGKTTFAQAIARGAGIAADEYVCSPTFGLMHEYSGRLVIYHMDFYRIASVQEIIDAGLEDYFYSQGLTLIEWYQHGAEIIPDHYLKIQLTITTPTSRRVALSSASPSWQERIAALAVPR